MTKNELLEYVNFKLQELGLPQDPDSVLGYALEVIAGLEKPEGFDEYLALKKSQVKQDEITRLESRLSELKK